MFARFAKAWGAGLGTALCGVGFQIVEVGMGIDIAAATEISISTVVVGLVTALFPKNAP